MFELLKKIFSPKPKVDFAVLVSQGATILDVRTKAEFTNGHIRGAVNIPVEKLAINVKKLKGKDHPIITCCESGSRSGYAKSILKSHGFSNVHNGGRWVTLKNKIK